MQIEDELVVVGRDDRVVVEVLVQVGLAVLVEVFQPGDLVAAGHVNFSLNDLQPERLEQTGGEALPGELLERLVDARDDPHVAVEGANRRPSVGEEVEAPKEGAHPVRIREGLGDGVHHVGAVATAGVELALGGDRLRPVGRTALGQLAEVSSLAGQLGQVGGAGALRGVSGGDRDAEGGSGAGLGQREDHLAVAHLQGPWHALVNRHCQERALCGIAQHQPVVSGPAFQGTGRGLGDDDLAAAERSERLDCAHDDRLVGGAFERGAFQHLSAAHRVLQHHLVAVQVEPLVVGPVLGQRSLVVFARIGQVAADVRPTRTHRGLEHDVGALDRGRRRPLDLGQGVAEFEEFAGPGNGQAQRVEVIDHVAALIGAEVDGQALHGRGDALAAHDRAGPERSAHRPGGRGLRHEARGQERQRRRRHKAPECR